MNENNLTMFYPPTLGVRMRRFVALSVGFFCVLFMSVANASSVDAPIVARTTSYIGEQYDSVYAAPNVPQTMPNKVYSGIPSDQSKRCPNLVPMFVKYELEPVEVFSYIAWRESNCNEKAINARYDADGNLVWTLNKDGSIDRGLLQVNSTWKTVTAKICKTKRGDLSVLLNLDCNLKVAKYLLDNGGLSHWSIYP